MSIKVHDVRFTYDAASRVKTQTLPDTRTITYGYDANGNLTRLISLVKKPTCSAE